MFLDPSPRCSFVALKQLCTKKCGRNCRLDIGLYNHTWTSAIFQKSCNVFVPCPQPFPTFFGFWVCLQSPTTSHLEDTRIPQRVLPGLHGPAEFRCLLLALASWARWDSWAQILGSLGLERMNLKLRVPIFMANGQLQMVCRCVFFLP